MSRARYSLQMLIDELLRGTSGLELEEARARAILIRRELHRLNKSWDRSEDHSNILRHEMGMNAAAFDLLMQTYKKGDGPPPRPRRGK